MSPLSPEVACCCCIVEKCVLPLSSAAENFDAVNENAFEEFALLIERKIGRSEVEIRDERSSCFVSHRAPFSEGRM